MSTPEPITSNPTKRRLSPLHTVLLILSLAVILAIIGSIIIESMSSAVDEKAKAETEEVEEEETEADEEKAPEEQAAVEERAPVLPPMADPVGEFIVPDELIGVTAFQASEAIQRVAPSARIIFVNADGKLIQPETNFIVISLSPGSGASVSTTSGVVITVASPAS